MLKAAKASIQVSKRMDAAGIHFVMQENKATMEFCRH